MAKNAITGAARSQTVIETWGNFAVAAARRAAGRGGYPLMIEPEKER